MSRRRMKIEGSLVFTYDLYIKYFVIIKKMSEKTNEVVEYCFEKILAQEKRPLFVALAGDAASGKSYLLNLLKEKFATKAIPYVGVDHDDFLISRKDREPMKEVFYTHGPHTGKSHWELLENMFRLDVFSKVICELKNGNCAEYYPYQREVGTVSSSLKKICSTDFIIFDTSMMLDEMDFIILVDVDEKETLKRKLRRDKDVRTPEQIKEMHEKVQEYYWQRSKPKDPDIIIDNNNFETVKIVKG